MSPRGFYSRESISPYFTSEGYKHTERYVEDVKVYTTIVNRVKAFFSYPGKILKKITKH